uniref:Uncharacterized protein LOC105648509 isoform X2 n=1 Tax=Rhizophora mucronata TaxID=61149 RepID=A0A2P2JIR5_RHIMU
MLPNGTCSLLLEPVIQSKCQSTNEMGTSEGFILLISSTEYAYSDKDRAWIRAVANKFRGRA